MIAWQLKRGDTAIELPPHLENWDPSVDLEVSRKIVVDGARLRDESALIDGVQLRLLAGWHSEGARTKHFPWRYDLRLPNRFEGTIEFRIPGAEIATSVDLIVGAVLVAKDSRQPLVAASVPGSWLWKDVQELRLEQTHVRFPMEWTDFKRSGLPSEAPWYLDWPSQDWDAPLLGALRLRLNATNPAMRNVMELPETDGKRQIAIRSAILDIAKQLVIAALGSDDFVDNHAACPEGSVGFSIRLLIAMAFQGETMRTLRTRLRDHAGNFHMQLQAAIVPFRELGE